MRTSTTTSRLIGSLPSLLLLLQLAPTLSSADAGASFTDLSGASAVTYSITPVWHNGQLAWCWPFNDRTSASAGPPEANRVRANPIVFVEYTTGESAGDPIVTSIPGLDSYSDAWLRFTVVVPRNIPFNYYRDYATVQGASVDFQRSGYFNFPVVPPGSKLYDWSNSSISIPETFTAWFQGQKVYLFDFGAIPQDGSIDYVKTATAVEVFQDDEFAVPVDNGFPIVDAVKGEDAYTGFYDFQSFKTTGAAFNSLRSIASLAEAPTDRGLFLNCPIVAIESDVYEGNPPLPPSTNERSPSLPIPQPEDAPAISTTEDVDGCQAVYLNGNGTAYLSAVGWTSGKKFGCWNLGLRSGYYGPADNLTALHTVYQPIYDSGDVAGLPIFTTLPCLEGYSDAATIINVVVPSEVPFNFFKDAATIAATTLPSSRGGKFNYPIVQPGSTFSLNPADNAPDSAYSTIPKTSEGWFSGTAVSFVNFGPIASLLPNTPYVDNAVAVFPYRQNQLGDVILYGNPIFSAVEGDSGYSGFYGVGKIPTSSIDQFTDYAAVDKATISDLNSVLNCPTAYYV
ncbi:hypothetical protein HDU97_008684 [Phlyctochytrium planicorne]|nr:hypothetical protein HDU97_008684 [Phlyctochytrium planicorne]